MARSRSPRRSLVADDHAASHTGRSVTVRHPPWSCCAAGSQITRSPTGPVPAGPKRYANRYRSGQRARYRAAAVPLTGTGRRSPVPVAVASTGDRAGERYRRAPHRYRPRPHRYRPCPRRVPVPARCGTGGVRAAPGLRGPAACDPTGPDSDRDPATPGAADAVRGAADRPPHPTGATAGWGARRAGYPRVGYPTRSQLGTQPASWVVVGDRYPTQLSGVANWVGCPRRPVGCQLGGPPRRPLRAGVWLGHGLA